jgi:transposase
MPKSTVLEISTEEQAQRLAALRRARYGYLLALHGLLLCAARHTPTAIAACLLCSRSRVSRTVRAYRAGTLGLSDDEAGHLWPPGRTTVLTPSLRRSLLALLKATPYAYDWGRTRGSCAPLALTRQAKRGLTIAAETMRRWLHELGWGWKRATCVATDDDPPRLERLARIRYVFEPLHPCAALVFADEREMALLPKVGAAWMPTATPLAVMTPGTKAKHDLAGALEGAPGTRLHGLGPRKTTALFRDLLAILDARYSAERYARLDSVADNDKSHQAKAVEPWLAAHPRVTLRLLPTDCPRANPLERALGEVHDGCTRHHRRTRLPALVADVEWHLQVNGPWPYQLSALYDEPAVTAAVENIAAEEHAKVAA